MKKNKIISVPGAAECNVDNVMPSGDNYVVTGKAWYSPLGYFDRFLTRLTSTGAIDTNFTAIGNVPHINILTSFKDMERMDMDMDMITRIKILPDGKILVASDFTQIEDGTQNPPQRQWIARFVANGLLDNTFTSPSMDWEPPGYLALALQRNGRILVGGVSISRFFPNGSYDQIFDQGRGSGVNYGNVNCILTLPNGESLIGGGFTTYNGVSRPGIARIITRNGFSPALYLLLQN